MLGTVLYETHRSSERLSQGSLSRQKLQLMRSRLQDSELSIHKPMQKY